MKRFFLIWRKSVNIFMLTLTGLAALTVVSILFFILGYLVWNGGRAINWDFFTKLPKPVGETGGGDGERDCGQRKATFSCLTFWPSSRFFLGECTWRNSAGRCFLLSFVIQRICSMASPQL